MSLCDPMDYIAHQAPLSREFSRQEYGNELPFPSSRDLPVPGIESMAPAISAILQAVSLSLSQTGSPYKKKIYIYNSPFYFCVLCFWHAKSFVCIYFILRVLPGQKT